MSNFFGASLLAFNKHDGGIRPIAIGSTFRRLVSKLICQTIKNDSGIFFSPLKLGFATPMGCEKIIHAVRSYLHTNENSDEILLKLYFKPSA